MPAPKRVEVEIEGRTLSLSNLDKPMYPEAGFAKGHVIAYYTRVSPALLPRLRRVASLETVRMLFCFNRARHRR